VLSGGGRGSVTQHSALSTFQAKHLHFTRGVKKNLTLAFALTGLALALATASILSGCSSVARALNIENPRYSIQNLRPRVNIAIPPSASTIDIDFDLGVDNPNSVGLRLDHVDFDLLVNNAELLRTTSMQDVRIPARGFNTVHMVSRVGYENIRSMFHEIADIIQNRHAQYEVNGTAYYDTPIGIMRFPVSVYTSR